MVYLIASEDSGLIKIGSAANPVTRLRSLQTGSAERLHLVCTLEGSRVEEAELHRRFAHLRVRGEWFRPDPVLAAICDVPELVSRVRVKRDTGKGKSLPYERFYRPFTRSESELFALIVKAWPYWISSREIARIQGCGSAEVEVAMRMMRHRYGRKTIRFGSERLDESGQKVARHRAYRLPDDAPDANTPEALRRQRYCERERTSERMRRRAALGR
jgi:hypothetical protein